MNQALETYKRNVNGKHAAVLGFGISNRPLAKTLAKWGAVVTVFDKKQAQDFVQILPEYREAGIRFSFGKDYLERLTRFDIIFRSPGIRFDLPQIQKAVAEGARLTSEMEVFMELCPAFVYGVTGSDGKTTTTSLIYEMLKQEGYRCYLGGNIGTPLLDRIDEIKQDDRVILELSSFQLHTVQNSPHIAVITNITPNHLDIHKSMEEYIEAKKNIFRYQKPSNKVILNADNPITHGFLSEVTGKPILFSIQNEGLTGTFLKNGHILYRDTQEVDILAISDIKLPGMHNVENMMAAISAVMHEVRVDTVRHVAKTFDGVEHRIEFVKELNGISFYNDSIGSSPTRTIASLKAFDRQVVLIAGGYDKKLSYDELGAVLHEHVKGLILMGNTAEKIEAAYRKYVHAAGFEAMPIVRVENMEDAVEKAFSLAEKGEVVLLSPASASFDMYPNFMERGKHFKTIVGCM